MAPACLQSKAISQTCPNCYLNLAARTAVKTRGIRIIFAGEYMHSTASQSNNLPTCACPIWHRTNSQVWAAA
jgi:hypothetical protein